MNLKNYGYLLLLTIGLICCRNLDKVIDFTLPPYESKIVVEGYLEVGKPYQLLLTESVSYFSPPILPNLPNALVTITHRGKKDTLAFKVEQDTSINKIYTYTAKKIVQSWNEDEYFLEIKDNLGRYVTSKTRFLPPPRIDTIEVIFRETPDTSAYILVRFQDNDPNIDNNYRLVVNKGSLKGNREIDFAFQPRIITNNQITIGTSYRFKDKDTLFVSLYHIDTDYLDFLRTVNDASQANGNPFAQPAVVKSTVKGGLGIFTALSFDRKRLILKKK